MYDTIISRRGHSRGVRNALRRTFATFLTLAFCIPALAQAVESVDPETDDVVIKEVRRKLTNVRRAEGRPTVALVLCGGGAKGAAHIGVLKAIEELGIPVDFISGTSIGALVGGLYAVGYKADFIDSLFHNQNWGVTLTDKIGPEYIPYRTRQHKSRYLLTVPFEFHDPDFKEHVREGNVFSKQGLMSSLPAGYVHGFNVNNMLSSLTVGYQDSISFADLPIPFMCVATDLASCKAKNWGGGDLKRAMRASMSIPGLFNPVRTEDMILVDGGICNNFPVDLAVAVGADYIIGVDISDKNQTYYELNNVGDIFSQIMNILVKTNRQNIPKLDVYVRPDMSGYSSLSFTPQAIDSIEARGNRATRIKYDEMQALKGRMPDAEPKLRSEPAVNINGRKVAIGEVQFKGLGGDDEKVLEHLAGIPEFSEVDAADIQAASSRLLGSGVFKTVNYSLCGKEAPYTLLFNAQRAPAHQVGVGVRFDTEEWGEVLLGLGLNDHKLRGLMFDFEAKVGMNQRVAAKLSYSAIGYPAINLEADFANRNYKFWRVYEGGDREKYDTGNLASEVKLYISGLRLIHANMQAGLRFRYLGETHTNVDYSECYFGAFANASWNSFDDWYFPTRGLKAKLGVDCDFASVARQTLDNYKPLTTLVFDIQGAVPCCEQFAILPDFHLRHIFGRSIDMDYSLLHRNFIGGDIAGRHFEYQIPFAAISDLYAYEGGEGSLDHMAVINLELRYNPIKNLYISAFGGCFNQGEHYVDLFKSVKFGHYGAGIQAAYRTVAGPVKFNVHYSSVSGWGAYLALGMDF